MSLKKKRILITGGAGFIGTNLISALSKRQWEVIVLDALITQVHPSRRWRPPLHVKFIHGDICDKKKVKQSLEEVNYIVHLAAETGVGQSAYEISRYVKTNELGTAVLLEEVSKLQDNIRGIILASSRALYGEGRYACKRCGIVYPCLRNPANFLKGLWELRCPSCQRPAATLPSIEEQIPNPISIYGITKNNQEHLLRQFSSTFRIPGIALRFQNVYGPGQSLINPYTGILAVFSTRILSGNPIFIYEDGNERRDFIYIEDTVKSIQLALERGFTKNYETYNVGSGIGTTIKDIAHLLVKTMNNNVPIVVTGKYRFGDIRHAWADITKIERDFGFKPRFCIEKGIMKLVEWLKKQPVPKDQYERTETELKEKGLLLKVKVDTSAKDQY